MEKNMLNEIARMRKMMGLNENLNEYVDSVKIIDDGFGRMESIIKGLAVSTSARNDVWQESPTKAREFVDAFNKLVNDFVESDQQYDASASMPTEPEEKKKYVINQIDQRIHGFIYNRGSGSFVRAYSDPYKTQVIRALEKLTKELGLTYSNERLNKSLRLNTESTNGEMGYNPSPLGEDLSNRTGNLYMEINDLIDEKYKDINYEDVAKVLENILKGIKAQAYREKNNIGPVTPDEVKKNWASLEENDSNEAIGIVSSRGGLYAGYFKDGNLISIGDDIDFDNTGKLLIPGAGFPENGIKKYSSADELEKDICGNYEAVLKQFREDAPETVSLDESAYKVIKTSVNCAI